VVVDKDFAGRIEIEKFVDTAVVAFASAVAATAVVASAVAATAVVAFALVGGQQV
jgi:hypothetical protein